VTLTVSQQPVYVDGAIEAVHNDSAVSMETPATAVGESIPVSVTLDNNDRDSERSVAVTIDGTTKRLTAPAGEQATVEIPVPAGSHPRERTIQATLATDGTTHGVIERTAEITPSLTADVQARVDGAASRNRQLRVALDSNTREQSYTVTGIEWELGDETGTVEMDRTIDPGAREQVTVGVPQTSLWADHEVSVTARFRDRRPISYSETISFAPIAQRSITVDGTLDDGLGATPHSSLPADGRAKVESYGGPSDLHGEVWLTYDDESLYLTANVTDDEHVTGWPLWQHDSIQLGVTEGPPGTTQRFAEFQIADSPDGPVVYRGYQPTGPGAEPIDSADIAVQRRGGQTIYEVAIPWSELDVGPSDQLSMSVLINENDGDGRRGWIEWASGIGSAKNTALFRQVQLVDGSMADGASMATGNDDAAPQTTTGTSPGFTTLAALLALVGALFARREAS
jgi:hypothetical protein